MNSLEKALQDYTNILGQDYENLGKTQGSCCLFRKKNLLSYDVKKGWDVVQLGWIELFLRKLGFFKSTHLKNVAREWATLKATTDYSNKTLNKHIKNLWKKTYPQQNYPSYFVALGNTAPKQASVKLFCEEHGDLQLRQAFGKKINKTHKSNDSILVESMSCEKKGMAWDCLQTNFVIWNFGIQGWEPSNIETSLTEGLGPQHKKLKNFDDVACVFTTACFVPLFKKKFDLEDLKIIQSQLEFFIQSYLEISDLIYDKIEKKSATQHIINEIKSPFASIENALEKGSEKDALGRLHLFNESILKIYGDILKLEEKNYSRNLSDENFNMILKTHYPRNVSLSEQIDLHAKDDRTVFAIMGVCHALKQKIEALKEIIKGVDYLHSSLKKHKFVIYVKREFYEKNGLDEANQDLNLTAFK
jgi:hypothetical protein